MNKIEKLQLALVLISDVLKESEEIDSCSDKAWKVDETYTIYLDKMYLGWANSRTLCIEEITPPTNVDELILKEVFPEKLFVSLEKESNEPRKDS